MRAGPAPLPMLFAKYVFVVLHILTAAAYFGLGIPLARQARAFAATAAAPLGDQGARTTMLMTVFGILTFAFAIAAFLLGGWVAGQNPFQFYGPQYHASITLMLVLIAVHVGLVQLGWSRLREVVAVGADATTVRKRIGAGVGIAHLLWVVILVLMFWGQLRAGLVQL